MTYLQAVLGRTVMKEDRCSWKSNLAVRQKSAMASAAPRRRNGSSSAFVSSPTNKYAPSCWHPAQSTKVTHSTNETSTAQPRDATQPQEKARLVLLAEHRALQPSQLQAGTHLRHGANHLGQGLAGGVCAPAAVLRPAAQLQQRGHNVRQVVVHGGSCRGGRSTALGLCQNLCRLRFLEDSLITQCRSMEMTAAGRTSHFGKRAQSGNVRGAQRRLQQPRQHGRQRRRPHAQDDAQPRERLCMCK